MPRCCLHCWWAYRSAPTRLSTRNQALDHAAMGLAVVGLAVPTFVVLPFLGLMFGIHLHWLPVAGWEPGSVRYLVLPVIALALTAAGLYRPADARRHAGG